MPFNTTIVKVKMASSFNLYDDKPDWKVIFTLYVSNSRQGDKQTNCHFKFQTQTKLIVFGLTSCPEKTLIESGGSVFSGAGLSRQDCQSLNFQRKQTLSFSGSGFFFFFFIYFKTIKTCNWLFSLRRLKKAAAAKGQAQKKFRGGHILWKNVFLGIAFQVKIVSKRTIMKNLVAFSCYLMACTVT